MAQPAPSGISLQFGREQAGARHLALGWSAPEAGETWTRGEESILVLERPAMPGDYLLELECVPHGANGSARQRVHVIVNGHHVAFFTLEVARRLVCRVPWTHLAEFPRMTITLLLPDAGRQSGDAPRLALGLRSLRLAPAPPAAPEQEWQLSATIHRGSSGTGMRRALQLEPPQRDIQRVAALLQEAPTGLTRRKLDRIIRRRGSALFVFPQLANAVLGAAVRLGQVEALGDALSEAFDVAARVTIDPDEQDIRGSGTVLWTVAADGSTEFRLSQALARHSFAAIVLGNWLRCLPVYARYLRLPAAERVAGRTWLNLEHMGSRRGVAFCDYRPEYALVMDPRFMATDAYAEIRAAFGAAPVPWDERRPVALWRGQLSGAFPVDGPVVPDPWRTLPRARLCLVAAALGEAVDAGLTGIISVQDPRQVAEIEAAQLLRPRLPWPEWQRFKYQIDIDGHTSSWSGLFVRLLSGGVVLKVGSAVGFRQWYYDRLVPWVNYVPVEPSMADLRDKLAWLRSHDQEARAIGEAGRALALSMTVESETIAAQSAFRSALASGTERG